MQMDIYMLYGHSCLSYSVLFHYNLKIKIEQKLHYLFDEKQIYVKIKNKIDILVVKINQMKLRSKRAKWNGGFN